MRVDLHSHVIPKNLVDAIRREPTLFGAHICSGSTAEKIIHDAGYAYPLTPEFFAPDAKIAAMDQRKIDISVVSIAPPMFYYWADVDLAVRAARMVNDGIAEFVSAHPTRLRAMGSLPMGHPEAALAELDRIVREYGFHGVELGASIEGALLAEPRFRSVLHHCENLGVFIFAHPYYVGTRCGMEAFYLTNLLGNPWDTTLMASNLMLSGVLEAMPELNICLAHGGGFLPYQVGRLAHGYQVRSETHAGSKRSPFEAIKRFYYDTLLFNPLALRYLIDTVGSDRVCFGTDDPFDMAEVDVAGLLSAAGGLSRAECSNILGGNALRLLRE